MTHFSKANIDDADSLHLIHQAIQAEVAAIGSTPINRFDTAGAFLFIEAPFSHLLEPAFDSHQRPYTQLEAVATSYRISTAGIVAGATADNAGIASIAYDEGTAYTQDPAKDDRIGSRV